MGIVFGCALAVDYGEYEHASGSGGYDAGTGATSGISGGGGFGGGVSGAGGASSGGTAGGGFGGAPDGGAAGKAGSGGGCRDGDECAAATCSNDLYVTYTCATGLCTPMATPCQPYACDSLGCFVNCSGSEHCSAGNNCNLGECKQCMTCNNKFQYPFLEQQFCLNDSAGLWSQLVNCCQTSCTTVCKESGGNLYAVCGGASDETVSAPCQTCLNTTGCSGMLTNCSSDDAGS